VTESGPSWSVGEAGALAVKAARGVGMPWGLAEEAGFALSWLTKRGAPATSAICRYLSFYESALSEDNPPSTLFEENAKGWLCPVRLGTALSDGGIPLPARFCQVREPLLLVPFLAACATDAHDIMLTIGPIRIGVSQTGFASDILPECLLVDQADCQIDYTDKLHTEGSHDFVNRVPAAASACVAVLTKFAHKTYAPASEASRLAGAGAGLNDND